MPSGIALDIRNTGDLHDDSRNHHTITNHNAIPVRGIHGRCMDFNGTTAYLECGNHASLDFTGDSPDKPFTIESWIKTNDNTASQGIVCKYIASGKDWVYQLHGGKPNFYVYDHSASAYRGRKYNTAVDVDTWYHFVSIYDGGGLTSSTKLYLNKIQVDDVDTTGGTYAAMEFSPNSILIGTLYASTNHFDGTISSVTIYNYALDADTIKLHYRQQSPYYQEEAPTICL